MSDVFDSDTFLNFMKLNQTVYFESVESYNKFVNTSIEKVEDSDDPLMLNLNE